MVDKRLDTSGKSKLKWLLLAVFIFAVALYFLQFFSPKVDITFQIKEVTDKDFTMFVTYDKSVDDEKKIKENCRFLSMNIKAKHPILFVSNVSINKELLKTYLEEKQYLENTENQMKFLGEYTATGGKEYAEGIDIYMEGLTDAYLTDFFGDYRIEVTWNTLLTGKHRQIFYLKDYYELLKVDEIED